MLDWKVGALPYLSARHHPSYTYIDKSSLVSSLSSQVRARRAGMTDQGRPVKIALKYDRKPPPRKVHGENRSKK